MWTFYGAGGAGSPIYGGETFGIRSLLEDKPLYTIIAGVIDHYYYTFSTDEGNSDDQREAKFQIYPT